VWCSGRSDKKSENEFNVKCKSVEFVTYDFNYKCQFKRFIIKKLIKIFEQLKQYYFLYQTDSKCKYELKIFIYRLIIEESVGFVWALIDMLPKSHLLDKIIVAKIPMGCRIFEPPYFWSWDRHSDVWLPVGEVACLIAKL